MYVTQGLHRALQQHPERTAVYFGERTRSFGELGERVARLAGAVRELGGGHDERAAMLALNSDRYLEYQLAVPWAGGVLNPCNVRWSAAEIAYSLRHSGSRLLFVDDAFPRATWAFALEPLGTGATRLHVRVRAEYPRSLTATLLRPVVSAVHDFMERKQLSTLKEHVEAQTSPAAVG